MNLKGRTRPRFPPLQRGPSVVPAWSQRVSRLLLGHYVCGGLNSGRRSFFISLSRFGKSLEAQSELFRPLLS